MLHSRRSQFDGPAPLCVLSRQSELHLAGQSYISTLLRLDVKSEGTFPSDHCQFATLALTYPYFDAHSLGFDIVRELFNDSRFDLEFQSLGRDMDLTPDCVLRFDLASVA